jgi:hypothetical protein
MKLDYDATLRAISHALDLLEAEPDTDEREALRRAWLAQRERPQEPQPQMNLLAAQESRGANPND